MALGPMFFNIIGDKPSGPKALELFDLLIAARVWAGVNSIKGSFVFFFRERSVRLKGCDDLESLGGVYCLLKLLAMALAQLVVLSLKLIP